MPNQNSLDGKWREILKELYIKAMDNERDGDIGESGNSEEDITIALTALKSCFAEELKEMKWTPLGFLKNGDVRALGYNQAIDDVLRVLGGGG